MHTIFLVANLWFYALRQPFPFYQPQLQFYHQANKGYSILTSVRHLALCLLLLLIWFFFFFLKERKQADLRSKARNGTDFSKGGSGGVAASSRRS